MLIRIFLVPTLMRMLRDHVHPIRYLIVKLVPVSAIRSIIHVLVVRPHHRLREQLVHRRSMVSIRTRAVPVDALVAQLFVVPPLLVS